MKKQLFAFAFAVGVINVHFSVSAGDKRLSEEMTPSEIVAAAKGGNAEAQFLLGSVLTANRDDAANFSTGIAFLERAMKQDHVIATHNLAVLFAHGWVKGKTTTDAFNLYLRAAQAGFAGSQNNLGDMYEKGEGTAKSFGDAVHWYTRAAMQGEPTAYLSLGDCYWKGISVAPNPVEAYRWFLLAAKNLTKSPTNRTNAESSLRALEKTMTKEQVAEGHRLADRYVPLSQAEDLMNDPPANKQLGNSM
jgi:TPR repeat protein